MLVANLERVQSKEALVLIGEEGVTGPYVPARLCRRGDDGARSSLVLRLVVLREDTVLLDRVAGEWVAAAPIFADRPAMDQIVLVAGTVDEEVGLIGGLCPGRETPRGTVDPIHRNRRAWG